MGTTPAGVDLQDLGAVAWLGCPVEHPNVGLAHPLRTEPASEQALTLAGVPQAEP